VEGIEPQRRKRLGRLLDDALELESTERAAFLDGLGQEDAELRREVEALLHADAAAGEWLDRSLASHVAPLLDPSVPGRGSDESGPADGAAPKDLFSPAIPRHVGPYRVLFEAGQGGMGAVYIAERDDGQYRKRVALKVVRDDLVAPRLVRGFIAERQILASLQHPGIAALLDGGVAESGAPYYVMEYVEGTRIDRWCDQERLGIRSRLELFVEVCDAVAYAHRNLVLHRDLKPANILVTSDGAVKLLDFGIARLIAPREAQAEATGTLLRWLTPEYASPEQVRGEPSSTVSDVYSLGVLLYELLSGRRPFQDREGFDHRLAQAIAEEEPPRPSVAASRRWPGEKEGQAVTPAEIAWRRGTTAVRLRRGLRGDLDAIVLQALQRQPDQRYATVEAFAADVRRHLSGRAVAARRASRAYMARRFALRYRVPISATTAVVMAGLALGVVHTHAVEHERDLARAEADRAEQVAAFLVDLFSQSDPLGPDTGPRAVTEFLALGAARLRYELADQPELRASMLGAIGKIYSNLGDYADAEPLLFEALALRADRLGPTHDLTLESIYDLGVLRRHQGEYAAADSLFDVVLQGLEAGASSTRYTDLLEQVAELRRVQGDLGAADSLYRQVHQLRLAVHGPEHPLVSNTLNALGVVARHRDDLEAAERYHRDALAIRRANYGSEHAYVAESQRNLAIVLQADSRYAEARVLYEGALETQLRVLGGAHPQVGLTRNSYGALLRAMGDHEAAFGQYHAVLELQRAAFGAAHPRLAASISNMALVVLELGDPVQAEKLAREGLAMRLGLLEPDHPSVAHGRNILAFVLRSIGRHAEAEAELREADRIYVARLGPAHLAVATNRASLGFTLLERGDQVGAERMFRSALEIQIRAGREGHIDAARPLYGLGLTLRERGHFREAEAALLNALEVQRAHLPPGHADIATTLRDLQDLLAEQGREM
jgi:eukaryotic-like serine/threonine-protein kinase